VIDAVTALGIRDVSQFTQVESDYYEWELQRRADRVNAPSEAHLCKTLIFENTRCTHNEISGMPLACYIAPVNAQKLLNFGRRLKNKEISKKYYKFRLADPEVSFQLTGFRKGGVCPFGMKQPLPVILAESITKLEVRLQEESHRVY
ncbi:uncharacterized protein BYT42DRAFT_499576, partial [Radiomyces spectabilis]|uniref:uncharacterized protein n=1 Tax=Radiomyces spectabilis TaxID=64574 RepID=UPI0022206481